MAKPTAARTTAVTEAPAKSAVKEKKTINVKTTFAQFKRYEAFRREQKAAEAATAASAEAPAMLAAEQMAANAAPPPAAADAPAIPAVKWKMITTTANRKITLA